MADEGDEIEEPSLAAAGGGLDRTAASTESLPQMTNLEWKEAACSEDAIQKCVAAGAFHPVEPIEWRAPVKGNKEFQMLRVIDSSDSLQFREELTLRHVMDSDKQATKSGNLSELSMVLLNNVLSLPLGIILVLGLNEVEYLLETERRLEKEGSVVNGWKYFV